MNRIQLENTATQPAGWQLQKPVTTQDTFNRTPIIEGYASLTSVNVSGTIKFYVSSTEGSYTIDIYRMGYYGGVGARCLRSTSDFTTSSALACTDQNQAMGNPLPSSLPASGEPLVECSWTNPLVLAVPTDWVSGVYVAKLTSGVTQSQAYILFVVRDDNRLSDFLVQIPVATYQAYNGWGGQSSYWGMCCTASASTIYQDSRYGARKVSFLRPYRASIGNGGGYGVGAGELFTRCSGSGNSPRSGEDGTYGDDSSVGAWDYNMVRWLEKEGYDVTYCSSVDVHANPNLLLSHNAFLSIGHDEYWSRDMRISVEKARDLGVNLAFFAGNHVYGQVRFEASPTTGEPNSVLVVYRGRGNEDPVKMRIDSGTGTTADLKPYPNVTGFYNDDTNAIYPSESLIGSGVWPGPANEDMFVKDVDASYSWMFAHTGLKDGDTLPKLGQYEYNGTTSNFVNKRPPHTGVLVRSKDLCEGGLGPNYKAESIIYNAVLSGATVFSANIVPWSWGLDAFTVQGVPELNDKPNLGVRRSDVVNSGVQQMTRNLLQRFVQTNSAQRALAVVKNGDGLLDVFSLGTDGSISHTSQYLAAGAIKWNAWSALVTQLPMRTQPAAATNQDGRPEVYAVGSDGALWHHWRQADGSWSGAASLGGNLVTPPAAGRSVGGRIHVFAAGPSGAMWYVKQTAPNTVWGDVTSLGGSGFLSRPAVGANQDGRLEVFAVASDGALWHAWQNSDSQHSDTSWSGWLSLGGSLSSPPATGLSANGCLCVFAVGTDGALWYVEQSAPNNGWGVMTSLGSPPANTAIWTPPAVGANQDGRLEVFVVGTDGRIWHKWQLSSGDWSKWNSFGYGLRNPPVVATNTDGRQELFAMGMDSCPYHLWQTGPNLGWIGPVKL